MDSEEAIYGELYYHSNRFCLVGKFQFGSLVRRLKEAVMRFSVHSCWSPILESSRTPPRVFSSGFSRKFQNNFYRTTRNCYFGTKKKKVKKLVINCFVWFRNYLWKVSGIRWFLLEVPFKYHFPGVIFKKYLWPRKSNNKDIAFFGKEGKKKVLRKQEVFCKNVYLSSQKIKSN